MDPDQFTSQRAGRLIAIGRGEARFYAFSPAPIPTDLGYTGELVLALSDADRAVGRLAGLGERLPNPHLLIGPYLRREALASTRIEGTQSTLGEVLSAEAQQIPTSVDVREVLNYVHALEFGITRLEELPLSNRLLRELHAELLRGVRGQERTPGEFRTSQNWLRGSSPADALFVPPPAPALPEVLGALERYLHENPPLPLLIRAALIHYQFETIHPFLDGNGRLGRLLIVLYLLEQGALRQPLLYLSRYFERNRDAYEQRLQRVRERGEYEEWVTFFLRAIAEQATAALTTAEALISVREDVRDRLRRIRARGQAIDAAERLIDNPYVTTPGLADALSITRQGAQYVIATLERAGIIRAVPGDRRPALYVAADVLTVLQRDD